MSAEANDAMLNNVLWEYWPTVGKVNKNFSNTSEVLWYYVQKFLEDYKGYNIAFTGHSIGGAIASLIALEAIIRNFVDADKITLYTFGELTQDHDITFDAIFDIQFVSKNKYLIVMELEFLSPENRFSHFKFQDPKNNFNFEYDQDNPSINCTYSYDPFNIKKER
uniref:Fungal lipase-like domain-containing protein n=1 Tax=Panagrolaimus sp. PS1159 TaxID=55785 RepID=A0AC35EU98_9BILA